jgi:hypothetical protein
MRDTNNEFKSIIKGAFIVAAAIVILCLLCSSCKVLKSTKSNVKDSLSVQKVNEGSVRVDSSGSKSDRTKETVFYPQPIYIEGKNGESKIIFVPQSVRETEKVEDAKIIKDDSWRQALDSLSWQITNREMDKKVKVGPSFIEWCLIIGLALLLLKNFLPFKIIKT